MARSSSRPEVGLSPVLALGNDSSGLIGQPGWIADRRSPITGYRVTATPGGRTVTTTALTRTATVTGLVNGVSHTFKATPTNVTGTSLGSWRVQRVWGQDRLRVGIYVKLF